MQFAHDQEEEDGLYYTDREEDLRDEGNTKKLFSPSTRAYQFNTYGDS